MIPEDTLLGWGDIEKFLLLKLGTERATTDVEEVRLINQWTADRVDK